MPKLSLYSKHSEYDENGPMMSWHYWTDEEKSWVIKEAYKRAAISGE